MPTLLSVSRLHDVNQAAQYLLGCEIWRTLPSGQILKVKIVETESYHQDDPASHTFGGPTARNQVMFGPAGRAYVYFSYGLHWCFNVTTGPEGYGAAILIRAGEPINGIAAMQQARKNHFLHQLTNGPAKLAEALQIDKTFYGHDLTQPPLQIIDRQLTPSITLAKRIGISRAVDELARFYISDNPFVSKI